MSPIENRSERYGDVAIGLHWIMAVLLIALVALGVYMVRLPDAGFDTRKIQLILFHKDLGMVALVLVALRLAWRVTNALPRLVETLPEWQKVAARFVHLTFYALMFSLPVTGWLMSSAGGFPVSFLGFVHVPNLIRQDEYLFHVLVDVHKYLGYGLAGLIVIHAGAALRHHFLLRDDTLRRMLPASAPGTITPPVGQRTRQAASGPPR